MKSQEGRANIEPTLLAAIDSSTEENGFDLAKMPPGTRITFRTRNTEFDIEIRKGQGNDPEWLDSEVWIKGHHVYCPDWTFVHWNGSTFGGSCIKLRWLGVGMFPEFFVPGTKHRVRTTAVESIIRRYYALQK